MDGKLFAMLHFPKGQKTAGGETVMQIGDKINVVERFMDGSTRVTNSRNGTVLAILNDEILCRVASFGEVIQDWFPSKSVFLETETLTISQLDALEIK